MQDKLARLSKLSVAERARVMSEALLVCSEEEAQHIAPALVQLAVPPTLPVRPVERTKLPHASSGATRAGHAATATPRRADGKPDLHALRARYGLAGGGSATGTQQVAASIGAVTVGTQDEPLGFMQRLRNWWQRDRVASANAALVELARGWAGVPALSRDAALAVGMDRWHLAAEALADTRPRVLRGVALLAAEAADARLVPHVLAAAKCADEQTREAARWAFFALAVIAGAPGWSAAEREAWTQAVQRDEAWRQLLTRGLAHGLRGDAAAFTQTVLAALRDATAADAAGEAAIVLEDSRALRELVASSDSPAARAAASAIKSLRVPHARQRALVWLAVNGSAAGAGGASGLASACAVRLARTHGIADHIAVLERAALTLRPARRSGLARVVVRGARKAGRDGGTINLAQTALPSVAEIAQLPAACVRAVPRWAASIAADAPVRERALEPLLTHADVAARFAAAMHGPARLARDFMYDSDARVARCAAVRTAASMRDGAAAAANELAMAMRSPHAQVAHIAAMHTARYAPAFTLSQGGAIATQRLLASDRTACLKTLRWMLGEVADAPRAMQIIRRVGVVDDCLDALYLVARQPATSDEQLRIAASACIALGDSNQPAAAAHARSLLAHNEARVRANAIEALARLARRGIRPLPGEVIELKTDSHHRVRANATREALSHAVETRAQLACADDIASMLADVRPMHRLAGLWLASRTLAGPSRVLLRARWTEMTARVASMASGDDDQRVRTRAAACCAATAALTRASWIASTSDLMQSDEATPAVTGDAI